MSPNRARPDLELRHVRVFVALVEHGSITAASRALGCAQSTVSEALAALERALGTVVVQRQPGIQAATLTTAGHALLPHARQVLAAVDRTHAAVAEVATNACGAVEIAASESVSTYLLPEVLAQVRARWPNVRFSVSVAAHGNIRGGVDDGSFDVGLLIEFDTRLAPRLQAGGTLSRFADRQIIAPRVPLVIFTAPSHPSVAATAHEPADAALLAGLPLLVGDDTGEIPSLITRALQGGDLPGPYLQPSGSVEAVKRGVIAEPRALGMLPSYAVAEDVLRGRVARLALRRPLPPMRLVAVLSRSRARHPAVDALLEATRRAFVTSLQPGSAGSRQQTAG